jgi:hypothetical protein
MTFALLLHLALEAPPDPTSDELAAAAQASHDEGDYTAAAEDYLTLSARPDADRDAALNNAHLNLDAAFVKTGETDHLCRALQIAQARIAQGAFKSDQARLAWEEMKDDDRARLAAAGGLDQCAPVSSSPSPRPIALLAADVPTTWNDETKSSPPTPRHPIDRTSRRARARINAGAAFTGVGVGLAGLMAWALTVHQQQHNQLRRAGSVPDGYKYTDEEEAALRELYTDAKLSRAAGITLGLASAAALSGGIALLVTGRQTSRRMALTPRLDPQGGGIILRLRF